MRSQPRFRLEASALGVVLLLGAGAAGLAGASPTGWRPSDFAWSAGFAAVVGLSATRPDPAQRSLFATGSVIAAAASPGGLLWGVAALVVSAERLLRKPDGADGADGALGAAVGVLAVNGLLRLDGFGPTGASALVTAALVLPVLVLGWRSLEEGGRRRLRRAAFHAAWVGAVSLGLTAATLLWALGQANAGVNDARRGAALAREGDVEGAAAALRDARSATSSVSGWLVSPPVAVTQLIPLVGIQVRAVSTAATEATNLADAALGAVDYVDDAGIEVVDGALDLDSVDAAIGPLEASVAALERAESRFDEIDSPWLVPQLGERLDEIERDLDENLPSAELALRGARLANGFLGGAEPRRYLVLFTTPVESRFLGGFVPHFAEVEVDGGDIEILWSDHSSKLHADLGEERTLVGLDEYVERHAVYGPGHYLENATASPDGPTASEVARQTFRLATGRDVDAVAILDTRVVAALATINGPIWISEVGWLDYRGLRDFLHTDLYAEFRNERDQRRVLDELVHDALDAVFDSELDPSELLRRLGPLVEQGRMQFTSFDATEEAFLLDVGLSHRFPRPGNHDLISVRTANSTPNKLDAYLERDIVYEVEIDPATGALTASMTLTLANQAPEDLPRVVEGGWYGTRRGDNYQYVSVYSPHELVSVDIEGEPEEPMRQSELGWNVTAFWVVVPRDSERAMHFTWTGSHTPNRRELIVPFQPLVRRDHLRVTVRTTDGRLVARYEGEPEGDVSIDLGRLYESG